jgi:hypothetical protein
MNFSSQYFVFHIQSIYLDYESAIIRQFFNIANQHTIQYTTWQDRFSWQKVGYFVQPWWSAA